MQNVEYVGGGSAKNGSKIGRERAGMANSGSKRNDSVFFVHFCGFDFFWFPVRSPVGPTSHWGTPLGVGLKGVVSQQSNQPNSPASWGPADS